MSIGDLGRTPDNLKDPDSGSAMAAAKAWQSKAALSLGLAYVAVALAVTPWIDLPLPPAPGSVGLLTGGLIVCEIATVALLIGQMLAFPLYPVLLLACAYGYSAIMAVYHVLTFPGALLPSGTVMGGGQITAFGYNAWRLGFVGLLFCAACASWRTPVRFDRVETLVFRSLGLVAVAALLIAAAGLAIYPALPEFVHGTRFSTLDKAPGWVAFAIGLASLGALFRPGVPNTAIRAWFALALVTYCGDLYLGTLGGGRYTLGWYAGRVSGFASGSVLFLLFLAESLLQQRRLVRTERALRARTLSLQVEMARRSETEARLSQVQKIEAIGQISGGIAHDFNNLLAVLVGNLDMLKRAPELGEKARKWVDRALQAAERGAKLTGQLLVFSRAQRLEIRPVLASEVISDARALLAGAVGPKFTIELDLEDAETSVLSEPTQLELAMMNLVLNARDAMPDGGRIRIRTRAVDVGDEPDLTAGSYLEILVSDTGVGMAPDVAARAFDPFFTTKPVGQGTGLGLAQVFGLARRAGGTAKIESAVDRGTRVRLFLPIAGEPVVQKSAVVQAARHDATKVEALIVDDDADVRETLAALLADLGATVRSASDGEAAVSTLDEFEPDVLLVDFAMPGIDGAEVARMARARYPELPIVFVTGFSDSRSIERVAGKDALILRKPFRDFELHAILAEALGRMDTSLGRAHPES